MSNYEYNQRSPTYFLVPSRLSRGNTNSSHDRPRTAHAPMGSSSSSHKRASPRSSRQAPPPLTNLPRFHPANFANYVASTSSSTSSSTLTSPESQTDSPIGPLSPRTSRQTSHLSEAQRQLYIYHKELYSINRSGSGASSPSAAFAHSRPASPNLLPLASPGAVTPLELEDSEQSDGYLVAGFRSRNASHCSLKDASTEQLLDSYISRETQAARPKPQ